MKARFKTKSEYVKSFFLFSCQSPYVPPWLRNDHKWLGPYFPTSSLYIFIYLDISFFFKKKCALLLLLGILKKSGKQRQFFKWVFKRSRQSE